MHISIIGAGIGGTVTAIALRKAGIDATIYEAHPTSAAGVGAYLTLAKNGIHALSAIDIPPDRLTGGFDTPRMAMMLGDGTKLAEFDGGADGGIMTRTIRRADLYEALAREAVARGVRIEYGRRLVGAETAADRVTATFSDGSRAESDALIGADGLRSKVRSLIDPQAPPARYVGLLNVGGYARGVHVEADPGTFHFVFGYRGFFGWVKNPNGEVWWFANPARAEEPSAADLAKITPEMWRNEIRGLFADDRSPALALIDATPEIFAGWPTYDFPSVPVWHRARMLIVGDAAHAASPSSGQGASMAIEDGITVARCLRDAPSVEAAFQAYERARRRRVEDVVRMGKQSGSGKAPGPVGRFFRDLFLRALFTGSRRTTDPQAWVTSTRLAWD